MLVGVGVGIAELAAGPQAPSAPPSGFAVQPDISDPLCNGGRGVRLRARFAGDSVVADGTMADGSTVIALSEIYPGKSSAVLYSVTRECVPNRAFGNTGAARIAISASRTHPAPAPLGVPPAAGVLWVQTVAARRGGGAIVAGTYGDDWVVGEVTQRGQLDSTFGNGGWTVLPYHGGVTAVVQEPSGRIVVGGDNGGGGCCTLNWVAAVSARGRLENRFGTHGREELPTGEDSGVDSLALEPNGDILAAVGYGNMGCWGVALAMLTPSGRPVPLFAQRLAQFWQRLGFGAFVGDAYVSGAGFTLAGTGQRPCAGAPSFSAPSATGLITRFRADGEPVSRPIRFPSRLYGTVQAFRDRGDTLVVDAPYADQTQFTVTARRSDGSVDPRFGNHGHAQIHTPWTGRNAALGTAVAIAQAGPGEMLVIATESGLSQLQIIRVRL